MSLFSTLWVLISYKRLLTKLYSADTAFPFPISLFLPVKRNFLTVTGTYLEVRHRAFIKYLETILIVTSSINKDELNWLRKSSVRTSAWRTYMQPLISLFLWSVSCCTLTMTILSSLMTRLKNAVICHNIEAETKHIAPEGVCCCSSQEMLGKRNQTLKEHSSKKISFHPCLAELTALPIARDPLQNTYPWPPPLLFQRLDSFFAFNPTSFGSTDGWCCLAPCNLWSVGKNCSGVQ